MSRIIHYIKKLIPISLWRRLSPLYHYSLALLAALRYRFPTRHITVIGVTGTKGKTSTVEIINSIFEQAGYRTAVAGTLHFKIADHDEHNRYKMTMPGRFVLQGFFRQAIEAQCDYAIVEMTSQGVLQYRHKFIYLDALVFTNISPEHIESHGSFENYLQAKLEIARALKKSPKQHKKIISNTDDKHGKNFIATASVEAYPFSLAAVSPIKTTSAGTTLTIDNQEIETHLIGRFNAYNAAAALTTARAFNVDDSISIAALESFSGIRGRVEDVFVTKDQPFRVIVDYAHTPDSLEKLYAAFPTSHKIAVIGGTGGGRDKWKRTEMARIAATNCDYIFLTDEDPYDEDPRAIVESMAEVLKEDQYEIEMDRRVAMRKAFERAQKMNQPSTVILITGKGTDPYIMRANSEKEPWDDATIAREELQKVLAL
jgi:UDP-N-acetylmuramoyl-L-alanyl-D-glutamate--2,6-diaminopimelate ligase